MQPTPIRNRGWGPIVGAGRMLLDQEAVFGLLGALHLLAHPHRRHASAGPLQGLVLLRLVFRLGLRALAGSAIARCDGLDRCRRCLRYIAAELRSSWVSK